MRPLAPWHEEDADWRSPAVSPQGAENGGGGGVRVTTIFHSPALTRQPFQFMLTGRTFTDDCLPKVKVCDRTRQPSLEWLLAACLV